MAGKAAVNDFVMALHQLTAERGLAGDVIVGAIETALLHAYRREYGAQGDIRVKVDLATGQPMLLELRKVTLINTGQPDTIPLVAARQLDPQVKDGDKIELPFDMPPAFSRIAAQTCKQVVLQKMREAERGQVFEEFSNLESELVSGIIQRIDQRHVYVNLDKSEAVLPPAEQNARERYRVGLRLRYYLLEVHRSTKGPQLILSRTHPGLLRRLLELEVPEIHSGAVEIKNLIREAGSRSKVAVWTKQEGLDPIGACVGVHRSRIQNIVLELQGERADPEASGETVDIIRWDPDPATFVANAISPAQVLDVRADVANRRASVTVPAAQMSLAIGKQGQNARLAAKLTGWRIDIRPNEEEVADDSREMQQGAAERVEVT